MKTAPFTFLLLFFSCFLVWPITSNIDAGQITSLRKLISKSLKSSQQSQVDSRTSSLDANKGYSPIYVAPQEGLMDADKINALPGQPNGVDFSQYAGYVTVDPQHGRALFYYFTESPENASTKPLVLWLNGGPGCSSMVGAMTELGPFRVNPDRKTLFRNDYAWNNESNHQRVAFGYYYNSDVYVLPLAASLTLMIVANVIYLESPAGVGFSYSNTSSDYDLTGDKRTAEDAYAFLVNWLERFPQYKTRDFYITGESYAGHYVPQLAYTILLNNNHTNQTIINLKGIAVKSVAHFQLHSSDAWCVGNGYFDEDANRKGTFDYLWTHAMISDETSAGINANCYGNITDLCSKYEDEVRIDMRGIDGYNIYAPLCPTDTTSRTHYSFPFYAMANILPCCIPHGGMQGNCQDAPLRKDIMNYDPCSGGYMTTYLNIAEVQKAMHANVTGLPYEWSECSSIIAWQDMPSTVLPVIDELVASDLRIWFYSGDVDTACPITGTKYFIHKLGYAVDTPWRDWYSQNEVGGYVVKYKGLVLVTVRGAGHLVPSYQPSRALTMISSFLQGVLPPSSH
ncbi:hypothetical protein ACLOJK_013639 [Asimina triloba]